MTTQTTLSRIFFFYFICMNARIEMTRGFTGMRTDWASISSAPKMTNKESPIELLNDVGSIETLSMRESEKRGDRNILRPDGFHQIATTKSVASRIKPYDDLLFPFWTLSSYFLFHYENVLKIWKRSGIRFDIKLISRTDASRGNRSQSSPFPLTIAESNSSESSS